MDGFRVWLQWRPFHFKAVSLPQLLYFALQNLAQNRWLRSSLKGGCLRKSYIERVPSGKTCEERGRQERAEENNHSAFALPSSLCLSLQGALGCTGSTELPWSGARSMCTLIALPYGQWDDPNWMST